MTTPPNPPTRGEKATQWWVKFLPYCSIPTATQKTLPEELHTTNDNTTTA